MTAVNNNTLMMQTMARLMTANAADMNAVMGEINDNLEQRDKVQRAIDAAAKMRNAIRNKDEAGFLQAKEQLRHAMEAAGYTDDSNVMALLDKPPFGSPTGLNNEDLQKLQDWSTDITEMLKAEKSGLGQVATLLQTELQVASTAEQQASNNFSKLLNNWHNEIMKIIERT